MKSKAAEKAPHLTRGSVLDDLGFSPSETFEIKVKAELYRDLMQHIRDRGLSQQELASLLDLHQPDVSNLLNGKVSKFSIGKLIQFAGKMNLGAKIRLTKPRDAKAAGVSASARIPKRQPSAA